MHTVFQGIWVPLVTPFQGDTATTTTTTIDHAALTRLVTHLARQGIAGWVVGATTGEGALLGVDEFDAVVATVRHAAPHTPLVLGLSETHTAAAVQRARHLATWQPDGLLVTPPSYLRPSQAGIQQHFEAVVEATDIPVLVYNIPYRTGVNVELDTLRALAQDPRVVGIKECGGTLERMQRLINDTPLRVMAGEDSQMFSALCLGAHGAIAASAHVLAPWQVRMAAALASERLHEARQLAATMQPLIGLLFAEPNPAPVKSLLAQQGWCRPDTRLPLTPATGPLSTMLYDRWSQLLDTNVRHRMP